MRTIAVLLLVAVSPAAFGQNAEQLTREQIAAAAARAALPAVDPAALKECQSKHSAALKPGDPARTAASLKAAALCFRAAQSLGLSIATWTRLIAEFRTSPEAREAQGELGFAHETAGQFAAAADHHTQYARLYPAQSDARYHLLRALCLYRQLGLTDKAATCEQLLSRNYRKKFDPKPICEAGLPIVVPKR